MSPPWTMPPRSLACAPERIHVQDPTGRALRPRGLGTKLAVNFMNGEPVSASVRMDYGITTVVQLDWITAPPRHDARPGGNVIAFPIDRVRPVAAV